MTASETTAPTGQKTLVFLLDVDNTLLDNDRLKDDISAHLLAALGEGGSRAFWRIYEEVRKVEDYVDYPATIKQWAIEFNDPATGEVLDHILDTIDFPSYVYPHVFEALQHLRSMGTAVILSDGDHTFQPGKIHRSGLEAAVDGVLIYVHKENELPKVFARYPADHYVMIDDKPRILAALENCCPSTFATVLVLQGKYAVEHEFKPPPDIVIKHIGDLQSLNAEAFLAE